eukprot:CAMPEP_0172736558 /NCGR_PEP_ID=MMETSP1074-20121228/115389_1 /TAXON_ID=2916 /ORGANISM="Ceratium fusus, Strain PA161109" /LENGTH=90 /DNA_ID=CAMNT_0013565781 /DNA_START=354 /DNA_END=623 /DNA_ORIENTATION=+
MISQDLQLHLVCCDEPCGNMLCTAGPWDPLKHAKCCTRGYENQEAAAKPPSQGDRASSQSVEVQLLIESSVIETNVCRQVTILHTASVKS